MKKKPLFKQLDENISKFTAKQATLEQLEPAVVDLGDQFNDVLHDLWKDLMTLEMQLYEQCEVSITYYIYLLPSFVLERTRNNCPQ